MTLIKRLVLGTAVALSMLGASAAVLADPPPPTHLIIVVIDANGYRNVWVCNSSGCVLQDRYWTGETMER
jgi:hypothetical protein